jgi:hypothetical protein
MCCVEVASWGGENDHHTGRVEPALERHTGFQPEGTVPPQGRWPGREDMAEEDIHGLVVAGSCTEVDQDVRVEGPAVGHGRHRASAVLLPWDNVHWHPLGYQAGPRQEHGRRWVHRWHWRAQRWLGTRQDGTGTAG